MQASIDHAELRSILGNSQGVVLMCPDVDNVPAHDTLNVVMSELNPKKHKVMIAESFGGNDEPVDKLTREIVGLGIEPEEALRVKDEPTEGVRCSSFTLHPSSFIPKCPASVLLYFQLCTFYFVLA